MVRVGCLLLVGSWCFDLIMFDCCLWCCLLFGKVAVCYGWFYGWIGIVRFVLFDFVRCVGFRLFAAGVFIELWLGYCGLGCWCNVC